MLINIPTFSKDPLRIAIRESAGCAESQALERLQKIAQLPVLAEAEVWERARELVLKIREKQQGQGGIDALLQEFSLSSEEGVVLMCLAEALLRIPDGATQDRMIQDRLGTGDWSSHLGKSESLFVNASAWGLLLTGKVTGLTNDEGANLLSRTIGRMGEPVIRSAMRYAMQIMGAQFVMGRDIDEAMARAERWEQMGYTYSYDMLGEGARTMSDADRYFSHYLDAIERIGRKEQTKRSGAGISVKLSALHPRYEPWQHERVMQELVPRLLTLSLAARSHNIDLTVDAEESWRLDISLEVIEAVFRNHNLEGWQGFGLAIQAYQKHGYDVVSWAVALAEDVGRKLRIRLVKGAYWDTEIKWAQERGHESYPVFTTKAGTDVSYQACARLLMANRDCVYPQFATHNAYSLAMILAMAREGEGEYEFQRLHGMGEELYDDLVGEAVNCRIYAPVGEHADLLAYLVRRLLENGANTSFVNNIQNRALPLDEILADPVKLSGEQIGVIDLPRAIYQPHRTNSAGPDLYSMSVLESLDQSAAKAQYPTAQAGEISVCNPARPSEIVGRIQWDKPEDLTGKLAKVVEGQSRWSGLSADDRSEIVSRFADTIEENTATYVALCMREAGKTVDDCLSEVREAVDFCRYYAKEAETLSGEPLGTIICISPWNFPLAIFVGQVTAALLAGNTVLAKPAEQTSLVALKAVNDLISAGVPEEALQLIPCEGAAVSEHLIHQDDVSGVMFTGSTATARHIARVISGRRAGLIPLIAETGGMNAMVVDSTALAEQVVDDVVASCFHSAGQRCSALRILYLQDDVADDIIEKIRGKMKELNVGDPADIATDVGPVIDPAALGRLESHVAHLEAVGAKLIERTPLSMKEGYYFAPCVYEISDLSMVPEEVFGPVLHLRRYKAGQLESVVEEINGTGYGLTFGIHSRIESRCDAFAQLVSAGNVYVNRNMVGAVVGVQPFGGRRLSGTGPKAGGPRYLGRLVNRVSVSTESVTHKNWKPVFTEESLSPEVVKVQNAWQQVPAVERIQIVKLMVLEHMKTRQDLNVETVLARVSRLSKEMSGFEGPVLLASPTGEENQLLLEPRGVISLCCFEPGEEELVMMAAALLSGNGVLVTSEKPLSKGFNVQNFPGLVVQAEKVCLGADAFLIRAEQETVQRLMAGLLDARADLPPLLTDEYDLCSFMVEKTITIDTTAAGGNASLLAGMSQ